MGTKLDNALMENTNPITKCIAVLCKMRLLSPALIGSGEKTNTDRDVYVDENMSPIIPGTGITGVLRSALDNRSAETLFGPLIDKPNDGSATSPLWIMDSPALTDYKNYMGKNEAIPAKIIVIDNVALDEGKVAKPGGKFDFEAIECGSYFYLRMELVIRKDSPDNLETLLDKLLKKLNTLYIGGKTSRGFGKLKCERVGKLVFESNISGLQNRMDFSWKSWIDSFDKEHSPGKNDVLYKKGTLQNSAATHYFCEKCCNKLPNYDSEHISCISATLKLNGSLLIRDDYSVIGDEDSAHITSAGIPVIYGTSWVGAIKNGLARFITHNGFSGYLDEVFGHIKETTPKEHYPSKVRVDASYFEKPSNKKSADNRFPVTRVKIDRWTGGTVKGALFTSRPQFNGNVTLTLYYPKNDAAILQLLSLALDAIDRGIITIGGETAIGRGVFSVEKISIDGVEEEFADSADKKQFKLFTEQKSALVEALKNNQPKSKHLVSESGGA